MNPGSIGIPACASSPSTPRPRSLPIEILCFLLPPLLCLYLYRRGLTAWFQADDFAWLSLRLHVHSWRDLWHELFAPMAQGTIRPLSERAFFLIFGSLGDSSLAGAALPFRAWVFLTQCANLTLLNAVTRRLTGSRAAGLCAAIFWLVNNGLAVPMVWTSTYNQFLCGFFLLGAFWFLLRYIESGRRRDLYWQWAFFITGFGALEINVVYPALAAVYTLCCARKHFRATLALFVPSLVFTAIHMVAAPAPAGGMYALHVDSALPVTFFEYGRWGLISNQTPGGWEGRVGPPFAAALAVCLIGFALAKALQRDWLPVFCLSWFVILLVPVVPLRDHMSDYYLVLPSIGLAMLGAYAVVECWCKPLYWKAFAAALAAAYLLLMVRADQRTAQFWSERSLTVKRFVLGVERARELHPGKVILIDDVGTELFLAAVVHHPFVAVGVPRVYLTPGSDEHILADASLVNTASNLTNLDDYIMPGGPALSGLEDDQIVVYRMGPVRLRNITSLYRQTALPQMRDEAPRQVDAGLPFMKYLLGPEWYALEGGHRWMPKRATFRIAGPRTHSDKLYLNGYGAEAALRSGPLPVNVTADGIPLPGATLGAGDSSFHLGFDLPEQLVGKRQMTVAIEVGRTFRPANDDRELGLAFGVFEIR